MSEAALSPQDQAAVDEFLAKRRKVSPAVLDTPEERARIHDALKTGCSPFDGTPNAIVSVQAHDIMCLVRWIDELRAGK